PLRHVRQSRCRSRRRSPYAHRCFGEERHRGTLLPRTPPQSRPRSHRHRRGLRHRLHRTLPPANHRTDRLRSSHPRRRPSPLDAARPPPLQRRLLRLPPSVLSHVLGVLSLSLLSASSKFIRGRNLKSGNPAITLYPCPESRAPIRQSSSLAASISAVTP